MKFRTTLILLLCVIILGSYILLMERKRPTTAEFKEREKKVFSMNAHEVDQLAIEKHIKILCKKENETWNMLEPYTVAADGARITAILSRLESAEKKRMLKLPSDKTREEDLTKYGLDAPRLKVQYRMSNGETVAFTIGRETPLGENTYLYKEGMHEIYIVDNSLYEICNVTADDLRDKTIFDFDLYTVYQVDFTYSDGNAITLKKEGETWVITHPFTGRGDHNAIETLLRDLQALRVERFIAEDVQELSPYGLDMPLLEIAVFTHTLEKQDTILAIGKHVDEAGEAFFAYKKGGTSVYSVTAKSLESLIEFDPGALRDRTVLAIDPESVTGIQVEGKDVNYSLSRRDDGAWLVTEPAGHEVNQHDIETILDELSSLEAQELIADELPDPAPYGLDKPLGRIKLVLAGKEDTVSEKTLLIGAPSAPEEKTHFATLAEEHLVFTLSREVVEVLTTNPLAKIPEKE